MVHLPPPNMDTLLRLPLSTDTRPLLPPPITDKHPPPANTGMPSLPPSTDMHLHLHLHLLLPPYRARHPPLPLPLQVEKLRLLLDKLRLRLRLLPMLTRQDRPIFKVYKLVLKHKKLVNRSTNYWMEKEA